VIEIDDREATNFFLSQVITGDAVDNYSGCPGAGPAVVEKTLNAGLQWIPFEHTFQRGPRKGLTETRWELATATSAWESVVSVYEKAGLTEQDALVQARCARILRHGEYDFKTKKVKLWEPN
jgi:DNA polymerase-1